MSEDNVIKIKVQKPSTKSVEDSDDEDFLACCGVKLLVPSKRTSGDDGSDKPAKATRTSGANSSNAGQKAGKNTSSNADDDGDAVQLSGKSLAAVAAAKTLLTESQQFIELLGDDEGVKQLQVLATSAP